MDGKIMGRGNEWRGEVEMLAVESRSGFRYTRACGDFT